MAAFYWPFLTKRVNCGHQLSVKRPPAAELREDLSKGKAEVGQDLGHLIPSPRGDPKQLGSQETQPPSLARLVLSFRGSAPSLSRKQCSPSSLLKMHPPV